MKRDEPKASTAIHGLLGIKYHPNEKANVIVNYLESQFTSHDLCDKNHEQQVETSPSSAHTYMTPCWEK
jgi:hypothetical protein